MHRSLACRPDASSAAEGLTWSPLPTRNYRCHSEPVVRLLCQGQQHQRRSCRPGWCVGSVPLWFPKTTSPRHLHAWLSDYICVKAVRGIQSVNNQDNPVGNGPDHSEEWGCRGRLRQPQPQQNHHAARNMGQGCNTMSGYKGVELRKQSTQYKQQRQRIKAKNMKRRHLRGEVAAADGTWGSGERAQSSYLLRGCCLCCLVPGCN